MSLLTLGAPRFAAAEEDAPYDCRFPDSARLRTDHARSPWTGTWFPEGDLFRPLLADLKQPRFYGNVGQLELRGSRGSEPVLGSRITAALAGLGFEYGIWKRAEKLGCDGWQTNIFAGIFSQFNLDGASNDLINSDFQLGGSVSYRRGRYSGRLRVYHQSSHLGDELVIANPDFNRLNLSYEVFDLLVSAEGGHWRVYAGPGYLVGAVPELEPGIAQAGIEIRGGPPGSRFRPIVGIDYQAYEAREWGSTVSTMAGIEVSNVRGTRRSRLLLSYLRGYIPFGQFFTSEKVESLGALLQLDL